MSKRCVAHLFAFAISTVLGGTIVADNVPPGRASLEDRALPPGAVARLGSLGLRHEQEVRSIAFSPDSKMIASVSRYDGKVRVWDTASGRLIHEINARGIFSGSSRYDEHALAFTPDGKAIAAGMKGDVCFWELQSGRIYRRFHVSGQAVLALTFSRDGKTFYCGGADNKLYQFDIASGKLLRSWDYFEGNQPLVYPTGFAQKHAVLQAISSDGKSAAWLVDHWRREGNTHRRVASELRIWGVRSKKDRCRITDAIGKDFFGAKVVFSTDGKYLTAHASSEMLIWDAATGMKVQRLGGGASVQAVAYSPDCRRVAAFSRENGLSVWDYANGIRLWHDKVAPWYAGGWHQVLGFSPDGRTLALADGNNVLLWKVASGKQIPILEGHRWPVETLAFSANGALISADYSSVCEWSLAPRQTNRHNLIRYHGHTLSAAESHVANLRIFHPDGKPPQLRELLSDRVLHEFSELEGKHYGGCFSEDGRTVALARREDPHGIVILDIPGRKVRCRLAAAALSSENMVLSRDGAMLAVARADQTVVLMDAVKGMIVRRLGTPQPPPKEKEPITMLSNGAFSQNGQLIAFGTYVSRPSDRFRFAINDDTPGEVPGIRVWNVATGRELRQFANCLGKAPHAWITSMRFSPDDKCIAVALHFNPSRVGEPEQTAAPVLEIASGRFRRRFKGHTDEVASVAFSPDGRVLATGSRDSTILLWDMQGPTQAKATQLPAEALAQHWDNLAARNAAQAYDSILALAAMPASVPFLAKRLKPIEQPPKEQLARWIADLGAESYLARKEASDRLTGLHELALPALKQTLIEKVSLEVRRRVTQIVEPIEAMNSPVLIRELRALEVLERIGNTEARRVLERLAEGAAEAVLTVAASESLHRLK